MVRQFRASMPLLTDKFKACLDKIGPLDRPTASYVLADYLKPIFRTAAHPGVQSETGRIKQNPLSVQNMYDEQPWKTQGVGCWNIMSWVLSHIDVSKRAGRQKTH